jgi:alkanesulfonate monooxygenase SsuD/methylene tetrahydromethanopterin reductase-like flavin-dependent oxidoreductase (luciferase family)
VKFDIGILGNQPVPTIVRQAQLAESLGYDTVWISDTHLVCRELWVTLTACALGTSRIRLGPGIAVPHTRHISVTASAVASLAELAEGRVVLGVGTGGSAAQTMGLTLRQTARIATLQSMARSLRRLLGNEAIRFERFRYHTSPSRSSRLATRRRNSLTVKPITPRWMGMSRPWAISRPRASSVSALGRPPASLRSGGRAERVTMTLISSAIP